MFVKICYGPLQYLTVLDVKTVNFTSHLQSNYVFNHKDELCFVENSAGKLVPTDVPTIIVNPDFIKDSIGCSPKGNSDDEVYVNVMSIHRNNDEVLDFVYTGTAYLCNELGRTVDTFR